MMKLGIVYFAVLVLIVLIVAVRGPSFVAADRAATGGATPAPADYAFTLQTGIVDGRMAYVGVGGAIDGMANPDLVVKPGKVVRVTLANGDGMAHDLTVPDLGLKSQMVSAKGTTTEIVIAIGQDARGTHDYFCSVSGHRQAGMTGKLIVR